MPSCLQRDEEEEKTETSALLTSALIHCYILDTVSNTGLQELESESKEALHIATGDFRTTVVLVVLHT